MQIKKLQKIQKILDQLSLSELSWISGYIYGKIHPFNQILNNINTKKTKLKYLSQKKNITILSSSQTGNAKKIAKQLYDILIITYSSITLINAGDYSIKKLTQENIFLLITSTYGNGEPPEETIPLYQYLQKSSSIVQNMKFAVFSLGDSSYEKFAQTGKDFDYFLEKIGGQRIYPRIDADTNYQEIANQWCLDIKNTLNNLNSKYISNNTSFSINKKKKNSKLKSISSQLQPKQKTYIGNILLNQKITSRQSKKIVHHIEIQFTDNSIKYTPGDAIGIWYENDDYLINQLLSVLNIKNNEPVSLNNYTCSIHEMLKKKYELTKNTPEIIKKYATISKNQTLLNLTKNTQNLQKFVSSTPTFKMFYQFPHELTSITLLKILNPMIPRLYSISSSQKEVKNEIHITVSNFIYSIHNKIYTGSASNYLINHLSLNNTIKFYIQQNNNFRLPKLLHTPIIMIATGTGIAPFRAFLQERAITNSTGKNWLFFGNPRFKDDFLYQTEFQYYLNKNILTKIDLSWSQDQDEKIYIQHLLFEQGKEIWNWLYFQKAHIYVCGKQQHIGKNIEETLIKIINYYGKISIIQSEEFLNNLRHQKRYQRDIY